MSRPTVLMAVYNGLAFDGRVQRAASALAVVADVRVLALDEGVRWSPKDRSFKVEELPIPLGGARNIAAFGRAFVERATRLRPTIVYAHDYYVAAAGAQAARRSGARYVYDAHELNLPEPGKAVGARGRLFLALERWGARRADLVVCANEPRAERFQGWCALDRRPVVVRNVPPVFEAGPGATLPALTASHEGTVRVLYQGDMGVRRRLERWIEAMTFLPPHHQLLMAGSGPALDKLRAVAVECSVADRVQFLGRVPRDTLDPLLRVCDIGILSYPATDLNNVYCAPNKVFEYAQCGLPMVAVGSSYLAEMIEPFGIGRCLPADASAEPIARMIEDVETKLPACRAACAAFAAENTWEAEAAVLRAAVLPLLGGARG